MLLLRTFGDIHLDLRPSIVNDGTSIAAIYVYNQPESIIYMKAPLNPARILKTFLSSGISRG
jgi:hypothetical protein